MTNAEKLLSKYDVALGRLDTAILHPDSSRYAVKQAIEMVEKARDKVLAAMKGEENGKG